MLLEMHCHTSKHSACSIVEPDTLVRLMSENGLDGMVITEHQYQWTQEEIEELRANTGVRDTFLILAAQEVDTDIGHVLVYGADRTIAEPTPLSEVRARYPGAALVWAHPFRYGEQRDKAALCDPRLDAIEVFNTNQSDEENRRGLASWRAHKFTAISGSDTHAEDTAGIFPTRFDCPVAAIEDVLAAIRAGRCSPCSGH